MSSGSGIENHRVDRVRFCFNRDFPETPIATTRLHAGFPETQKDPRYRSCFLLAKKSQNKKTGSSIDNRLLHKRNTSWRILRHTTMEMRGVRRKKSLTPNSRRRKSNFRQSLIPVGKRSKRDGGTRSRRGFNIRLLLSHRARALFFYCC